MTCFSRRRRHLPTIKKIPDELWYEIKLILPKEKPNNTIGRPVVQFRKVLNGILYVLRTGCQSKMCCQKSMVLVPHVIEDFRSG